MFGLSTGFITKGNFGHRKDIRVLTFRTLALRQSERIFTCGSNFIND